MKQPRSHLLALAGLMAAAGVAADPSTSGGAPDSNVAGATAEAKKRAPKNPENTLDIINGRLPMPLVAMIRRKVFGELSNADYAKAFGTSVGKVFDIHKGRNFGYIDAAYKPSAEEVEQAKKFVTELKTARTQKTLKDAGGKADEILAELTKMGVATADEVAKRAWVVRQVGAKAPAAAGTAPVAGAAAAPAAAGTAGNGAKLF